MKTTITPYVRPDGIIVGIKGKAPEKPRESCPGRGFCSCDDPPTKRCVILTWEEALAAFIQSGIYFEDQRYIMSLLPNTSFSHSNTRGGLVVGLLPPIELDVEEVENIQDPCTQCGSTVKKQSRGCNEITCYRGRPGFNRTVLRIAKEEQKNNSPSNVKPSNMKKLTDEWINGFLIGFIVGGLSGIIILSLIQSGHL